MDLLSKSKLTTEYLTDIYESIEKKSSKCLDIDSGVELRNFTENLFSESLSDGQHNNDNNIFDSLSLPDDYNLEKDEETINLDKFKNLPEPNIFIESENNINNVNLDNLPDIQELEDSFKTK